MRHCRRLYHCFVAGITVPDDQFSIQWARNGMAAITRKVNTSDFVDVPFQDLPTGGFGSRNGGTRSQVPGISGLFLLFTAFVSQGGKLLLQGLSFSVNFGHLANRKKKIKKAFGNRFDRLWSSTATYHQRKRTKPLKQRKKPYIKSRAMAEDHSI